jgi:hypothetical protein
MRQFNLVLATSRGKPEIARDLETIAGHVRDIDSRINAVVLPRGHGARLLHSALWLKPTLTLAPYKAGRRALLPGRPLTSRTLLKSGEYQRLETAGFPVPKWAFITPETRLDPDDWGPYVVEKPNFGGLGAYVRIRRTGKVRYQAPETYEKDHFGSKAAMLAQEFIYTGEWPQSFRVVTLLGQTILCYRQTTVGRGQPLTGRWGFRGNNAGSIVSNTTDMDVVLVKDEEIVSLCERAHRLAFPDVPLLGFDVIRDAETGKLNILECHSHGPSWSFSSTKGRSAQKKNGVDYASQYDAFRKCAEILAEATPRLAARRLPFQSVSGSWV